MTYHICPDCGAYLDPGERCDCCGIEKAAPAEATPEAAKKKHNCIILECEEIVK